MSACPENVVPFPRRCFSCKEAVYFLTITGLGPGSVTKAINVEPVPWGYVVFTRLGYGMMIPDEECDTDEPLYQFHDDTCSGYVPQTPTI